MPRESKDAAAPPLQPSADEKLKAFTDIHGVLAKLPRADQIDVLRATAHYFGIASSVEIGR